MAVIEYMVSPELLSQLPRGVDATPLGGVPISNGSPPQLWRHG